MDLTSPSLCALDNEGASQAIASDETGIHASGAPASRLPVLPPHIDDCFCCSHCVDVPAKVPELQTSVVDLEHESLVPSPPRGVNFPLYHPPLG